MAWWEEGGGRCERRYCVSMSVVRVSVPVSVYVCVWVRALARARVCSVFEYVPQITYSSSSMSNPSPRLPHLPIISTLKLNQLGANDDAFLNLNPPLNPPEQYDPFSVNICHKKQIHKIAHAQDMQRERTDLRRNYGGCKGRQKLSRDI